MIATTNDPLDRVANEYRADGYEVTVRPQAAELPDFLRRFSIDILARKGSENVVVAVRTRGNFGDDIPLAYLAGDINARPNWRFDMLVLDENPWGDAVPRDVSEPDHEQIRRLADRAEQLLAVGHVDASCLMAWSALEASLRESARRVSIPLEQKDPRSVLDVVYTEGEFTREEYDALVAALRTRNAIAHGLCNTGFRR